MRPAGSSNGNNSSCSMDLFDFPLMSLETLATKKYLSHSFAHVLLIAMSLSIFLDVINKFKS